MAPLYGFASCMFRDVAVAVAVPSLDFLSVYSISLWRSLDLSVFLCISLILPPSSPLSLIATTIADLLLSLIDFSNSSRAVLSHFSSSNLLI